MCLVVKCFLIHCNARCHSFPLSKVLWLLSIILCKMPLHKYPPKIWEALKLQKGIYARLPQHYLRSLQDTTPPTPVHWKPLGVKYRANPKTGQRERVQDVPIPIYYPPESQDGLWGGEGWISGFRYAKNDKVSYMYPFTFTQSNSNSASTDNEASVNSFLLDCAKPGSHSCLKESCTVRSSTKSSM